MKTLKLKTGSVSSVVSISSIMSITSIRFAL
jgi:hypothetical protein